MLKFSFFSLKNYDSLHWFVFLCFNCSVIVPIVPPDCSPKANCPPFALLTQDSVSLMTQDGSNSRHSFLITFVSINLHFLIVLLQYLFLNYTCTTVIQIYIRKIQGEMLIYNTIMEKMSVKKFGQS